MDAFSLDVEFVVLITPHPVCSWSKWH